ncbi:class III signal peptide-containing protein [Methanobacterium oryzae]|uniref:class III signal peptide-containing protein n=1 Tax=Methanobacterium oryzae TaxID=69540 RepID=UPI003D22F8D8
MKFLSDERGQGAAEYILLFGGVIVIAIAALVIYNSYFTNQSFDTGEDINTVREKSAANDRSL